MALAFTTSFLADSLTLLAYYRKLGEQAVAQMSDEELLHDPANANSVAVIVKHIAGNMRSRWTDFLSTDGEKPDRNRDTEFEDPPRTRAELLQKWNDGWAILFAALQPLTEADLTRTVYLRGEAHSVMQAINRQQAHYAYHIGQIVLQAKLHRGQDWQSLSVPRGGSSQFNSKVTAGETSQR